MSQPNSPTPHNYSSQPPRPPYTPSQQAPISYTPTTFNTATPPPPPPKSTVHQAYSGATSPHHHQQQQQQQPYPQGQASQQSYTQPQAQDPPFPEQGWLPSPVPSKSKPDLEHLLNTPSLLTALLHHPSHTPQALMASTRPLEALLASNIELAQRVTALQRTVEERRRQTTEHLLAVRAQEQAWRKKEKEMEDRLERFGPRQLHQRLGDAIREGEQVARAVEEGWIEDGREMVGEREVEEWIKRVREGRRLVWLRKERKARWDEGRVGGWR